MSEQHVTLPRSWLLGIAGSILVVFLLQVPNLFVRDVVAEEVDKQTLPHQEAAYRRFEQIEREMAEQKTNQRLMVQQVGQISTAVVAAGATARENSKDINETRLLLIKVATKLGVEDS